MACENVGGRGHRANSECGVTVTGIRRERLIALVLVDGEVRENRVGHPLLEPHLRPALGLRVLRQRSIQVGRDRSESDHRSGAVVPSLVIGAAERTGLFRRAVVIKRITATRTVSNYAAVSVLAAEVDGRIVLCVALRKAGVADDEIDVPRPIVTSVRKPSVDCQPISRRKNGAAPHVAVGICQARQPVGDGDALPSPTESLAGHLVVLFQLVPARAI